MLSLCITACDTRLTGIAGSLTVEPSALSFPSTATGDQRELPLTLSNRSRAPLDLHLASAEPFALDLDVRLAGGETRDVAVEFAPLSEGSAVGTLTITGDANLEVPLSGDAVAPATCTNPSSCRLAHRDPATNTCVEQNAADGSACSGDNACLSAGQCVAGACIGTPRSCDDANACTIDACEPAGGCAHLEKVCPEPADKCHVARCDPSTGCASEPAPDGTACGPSDCATAHVCMAGTCRVQSVPDGYACGDETPCRAKGRCAAGACNQAPASQLTLAWSHPMPYEGFDFRGVTDSTGNLYWVECQLSKGLNPCDLVSYAPTGLQRFRVAVTTLAAPGGERHLAAGGRIIVAGRGASLSMFSEAGVLQWARHAPPLTTLLAIAADRGGRVYTLERFEGESEAWSINTFEGTTGIGIRKPLYGAPKGLVLDTSGNSYFVVSGTSHPLTAVPMAAPPMAAPPTTHLISLTPTGVTRFQAALPDGDVPEAVFNGELLMTSGQLRSTLHGHLPAVGLRSEGLHRLTSLMAATHRYRWLDAECCPSCDCISNTSLEGYAAGATSLRFRWGSFEPYALRISQPQLLSDGSALFSNQDDPGTDVRLRALSSTGAEKFACLVDSSLVGTESLRRWTGATVLTQGRWAVLEYTSCPSCIHDPPPVLRVYATPGLSLATSGWTGVGGSPGRSGQPR